MDAYVAQLTDKERAALAIAQRMLGESFNLRRSIGFVAFERATAQAAQAALAASREAGAACRTAAPGASDGRV